MIGSTATKWKAKGFDFAPIDWIAEILSEETEKQKQRSETKSRRCTQRETEKQRIRRRRRRRGAIVAEFVVAGVFVVDVVACQVREKQKQRSMKE